MFLKPKDFLTIIESARITAGRLNKIHESKINIDSYTRGLIESSYIFLIISKETQNLAYKHFNIKSLILDKAAQEQKNLEQEIDFELGERKSNDFLDQQEEIRAAQKIMSVDGFLNEDVTK